MYLNFENGMEWNGKRTDRSIENEPLEIGTCVGGVSAKEARQHAILPVGRDRVVFAEEALRGNGPRTQHFHIDLNTQALNSFFVVPITKY